MLEPEIITNISGHYAKYIRAILRALLKPTVMATMKVINDEEIIKQNEKRRNDDKQIQKQTKLTKKRILIIPPPPQKKQSRKKRYTLLEKQDT